MKLAALIIGTMLCATCAQAAETCAPKLLASLDMTTLPDGNITVPVVIKGKTYPFVLEAGMGQPLMTDSFASNFATYALRARMRATTDTGHITGRVMISAMDFGGVIDSHVRMLRVSGVDFGDPAIMGTLTLGLFRDYDVEIDFAKNKFNLFSQDHCANVGAYWANSYATLPFWSDSDGNLSFDMKLNGKPVRVGMVTVAGMASMPMGAAHRLFGLDPRTPGLSPVAQNGALAPALYTYPFQSLSAGAFAIDDPRILIEGSDIYKECRQVDPPEDIAERFPEYMGANCFGGSDVTLGLADLRKLHLYFSLGDDVLYVTPADAHK